MRSSLIWRLGTTIIIGSIVFALFLMIVLRPAFLQLEDSNVGPYTLIAIAADDLERGPAGELRLDEGSRVHAIAERSPSLWLIATDGDSVLNVGRIPDEASRLLAQLGSELKVVELGPWRGNRRDDRSFALVEDSAVGPVRIAAGGIDPDAIRAGDWIAFLHADDDFIFIAFMIAMLCGFALPLAIPVVWRSLRPIAAAARNLDPARLDDRLPERGVVKELLPVVRAYNGALDRLAEAAEGRRRFIADVTHELRTPLAVLNMHVEQLPDTAGKADVQRTLYRLSEMTGQMLDAERLTFEGRAHVAFDLVEAAKTATADITPLAMANGYDVAFRSDVAERSICGDPYAVKRAITNLLGNAVAHGGSSGTIEVSVSPDAVLSVSDEGPGVPPEARSRIFEPFHRERWDRDGCGLGLYLVDRIMAAHGGRAEVNGGARGAVFRLLFPLEPADGPLRQADGIPYARS